MSRPSVAQYISDKRAEGHDESKIIHQLLDAGWHMDIIHKVMNTEIKHRKLEPILKKKQKPYQKYLPLVLFGLFIIAVGLIAAFL